MQYWQQLIVFLMVVLAALHVCAKYLPASWRQRVVYLLTRRGARASKVAGWLAVESGCGAGCASCKSAHPCSVEVESEQAPQRVIRLHRQPRTEARDPAASVTAQRAELIRLNLPSRTEANITPHR